ncbi:MAG: adenylate/guanylate cyclase domain-containing protein [Syntrophomonadaceae bacterium]|nr:adenylate/guanylate cyclase domain-containing protein [Syntrophomonadaceae bacterium]
MHLRKAVFGPAKGVTTIKDWRNYQKHVAIALLFLIFCLFAYLDSFATLENKLEDRFLQKSGPVDTDIIIIGIDDQSLEDLGRFPWSRYVHADLFNILASAQPAAIGMDVIFSEPSVDPGEDLAMVEAIREAGNVVLPVYGNFQDYADGQGAITTEDLVEPFPDFPDQFITGHINTFPDPDGIIRKTALYLDHNGEMVPSFAWRLYEQYCQARGLEKPELSNVPLDPIKRMEIAYTGVPGDYEQVSYSQVLSGEIPTEVFRDRIVLVGIYTVGIGDYYFTPLAAEAPMFGVEVHANILQNLLQGNYKERVPLAATLLIMLLLAIVAALVFTRFSPVKGLAVWAVLVLGYLLVARQMYDKGYLLDLLYPLLFVSLAYLVALAASYISEMLERRRITGVFNRYVAPQVVNKILEGGESALQLGGTRREITVLFVDIRGFTPLSEATAPEEVVEILNEYLTLVAQSIFQFGGTLDKFIGDAAMAIYNAPLDLEDHCFKAVQSAWAMKEGAVPLQQRLFEKFGRNVQFGIGVNTGPAVIGNIGASFRMDYTAIGDTVNTSARLESNAQAGQILISQAVYEQVQDRVEVTSLGEISVKGKTQGINVYQVDGIKA